MQPMTGAEPQEPILLQSLEDGVLHLTLNRPQQFNALSEDMLTALTGAMRECAHRPQVRVVVLSAKGKAFCAGHDLKQMRERHGQDYYTALFARCSECMRSIVELPRPVIARVHGLATAAGCQLVATCDLAVASESAEFAVSGINLGLFCSTPSVALSRNVLPKRAFEMLMTGEFINAATAVEYGLVNRAVPEAQLDGAIDTLTHTIKRKPPVAVETGKRLFYRQAEMSLGEAYRLAGKTMACNMMAEDTVEGVDAFIAKRSPKWNH
ncbi:MAG: enoyl-CoA hydratase [Gammaproteobacteria bacterium]|nr:enoyl-CoA hydratase [Gammaproteobacteria bacterium]NKC14401.1 enoyl-CoA hydratase [Gammaproteobacteria bacterium]